MVSMATNITQIHEIHWYIHKKHKKFPLSNKLYQHDLKCILNGISASLGLMKKDRIVIIGEEKGQKVMQNSSTWYHISIGNGT